MASKICSLHVVNKKGKTRAIGRSVLGPKDEGLIHFYTIDQVQYAQKLEEEKEIEIKTTIPSSVQEQIEEKKKEDEKKQADPVDQVRQAFNSNPIATKNNPEGWQSPNDAYRGEDLKDRENGFAATSSEATKEDSDSTKETSSGEDATLTKDTKDGATSAWNSPDDAYAGEDLKERDNDEETISELEENKSEEASKFEERKEVGPQDQEADNTEAKEESNPSSDADEDGKPSYYLTYEEVEGKTKQELIDWSEQEVPESENINITKGGTAKKVKEEVHSFLSGKFEDHAE